MRLIDADAFCDKFDPDTVIGNTMRKIIEGEPIAYDVDKVVERLEMELRTADDEKERCARENQLQFDTAKGYAHGVSVSLEIVKSGGIE